MAKPSTTCCPGCKTPMVMFLFGFGWKIPTDKSGERIYFCPKCGWELPSKAIMEAKEEAEQNKTV